VLDAERAANEHIEHKGYFVIRHADLLLPHQIVTDIRPMWGHKIVILGPASLEDIQQFDEEHARNFPKMRKMHEKFPYVYRATAE
jgi:hypothetical protein